MKTRYASLLIVVALLSAAGGWWAANQRATLQSKETTTSTATEGERRVLFYQSAMHPWVKSDKPGRCTICGMELTPVYAGDKGFDSAGGDVVALTQNQIQVLHVETAEAKVQPLTRAGAGRHKCNPSGP